MRSFLGGTLRRESLGGQMSKLVERECPRCGSDFLLRYRDKSYAGFNKYLYCPECDTLFRPDFKGRLWAMVKTQEPYADWHTMWEGYQG